jgi:hypothetical protein
MNNYVSSTAEKIFFLQVIIPVSRQLTSYGNLRYEDEVGIIF